MSALSPALAFDRLIAALEAELIAASDEEIAEALDDLGMKPGMKGSAALAGLTWGVWSRAISPGDLTPSVNVSDGADGSGDRKVQAKPEGGNAAPRRGN